MSQGNDRILAEEHMNRQRSRSRAGARAPAMRRPVEPCGVRYEEVRASASTSSSGYTQRNEPVGQILMQAWSE